MNHLHQEFDAGPDGTIVVTLDHPANVQLMDSANYKNYQMGQPFRYHGGYATKSPVRLVPPSRGTWHLVIDLGGGPGAVRASSRLVAREMVGS